MTKKEYIEREALTVENLEQYVTVFEVNTKEYGWQTVVAVDDLQYLPTADVEEVRYGEWLPYHNEYKGYVTSYNCSLCGRRVTDKEPYCHCGAKMDKKDN